MALDHLIEKARKHFNIDKVETWATIRPEWILKVKGCGEETLNHIRLYLIPHGLTLKDDATVDFWAATMGKVRLSGQLSESDTMRIQPFTILIDTREQQPWTFTGMQVAGELTVTPYKFEHLGDGHGDYTVVGCEDEIGIERKSIEDAIGTFLSHGERRERWQKTLEHLASIAQGSVAIEGSMAMVLDKIEARGKRSKETLRRTFFNQVHAWQMDYCVPFNFYDARRLAEKGTFFQLRRFWMQKQQLKEQAKHSANYIEDVIGSL